ncbi:MAG: response regulator [Phycisphaerales bacterium]|nr:response regulator [Phycisphaerales bacterium]
MAKMPKLRILHADDDESFRLLVRTMFESDETLTALCDLRIVEDGTEAVAYMRGEGAFSDRGAHPMPHLVLLDQRMNRMDGTEALREIRKLDEAARVPIFLLSTSDQLILSKEFLALGGSFCISKPLDFSKFKPLMHGIVDFSIHVLELPRSA